MDVVENDEQIGLIDFWGSPRPAWWAFKWWAELPVERVVGILLTHHSRTSQLLTPVICYNLAKMMQPFTLLVHSFIPFMHSTSFKPGTASSFLIKSDAADSSFSA